MITGTLKDFNQTLTRQAEPCPKTESSDETKTKASEWARGNLNFHP